MGALGFFKLTTLPEARRRCHEAMGALRTVPEQVPTEAAFGRVLAAPVISDEAVPLFSRSLFDGFALRSADVAGASGGSPAYVDVVGQVIMGQATDIVLEPGQAAEIPTGGMLPEGADSVVMVEHTERLGPTMVEVNRPVAPGAGIIAAGEDLRPGRSCLAQGQRLGAGALALLATVGISEVTVYRRPRVALLSTGDEVVPAHATPGPAQVRDANAAGLSALVQAAGGEPISLGIVKDNLEALESRAREALPQADVLVLSGGSSVGERDHGATLLRRLGAADLLFHGVALKPGKPTLAAVAGSRPVFGLPGHPLSALVSFHCFVEPLLKSMTAQTDWEPRRRARLARRVPSDAGRTEMVRVTLSVDEAGDLWAMPLFGKSAVLSSLVEADGLVEIPLGVEGLDQGAEVSVRLWQG
jgi:molybdopterin molybdotransferase